MIAVVDYGMGNLKSVVNALTAVRAESVITSSPAVIEKATKVILPGVGAFGDAMEELQRANLVASLKTAVASGKPFLGICLGLHLLFEGSEESPNVSGLGIFPGTVKRFTHDLKIPHMGWNTVCHQKDDCPLLRGVPDKAFFYFVHSYFADTIEQSFSLTKTEYGNVFTSMLWMDNVYAAQFHPEKSQDNGLTILRNFATLL